MAKHALCILFLHHRNDRVTRLHFDKIRRSNPDAVVIPVVDEPEGALPGAVDVSRFDTPWVTTNKWKSCDTMLYRWFLNRTCEAEKYLVLEYDVWCDVDVREYFREQWSADVLVPKIIEPGSRWYWWRELDRLPAADRPYATGVAPLAVGLYSHAALERICALATTPEVFSELRLGTAVRRAGLDVQQLAPEHKRRIGFREIGRRITEPGIYHPVKSHAHNLTRELYALRRVARVMSEPARAALRRALEALNVRRSRRPDTS